MSKYGADKSQIGEVNNFVAPQQGVKDTAIAEGLTDLAGTAVSAYGAAKTGELRADIRSGLDMVVNEKNQDDIALAEFKAAQERASMGMATGGSRLAQAAKIKAEQQTRDAIKANPFLSEQLKQVRGSVFSEYQSQLDWMDAVASAAQKAAASAAGEAAAEKKDRVNNLQTMSISTGIPLYNSQGQITEANLLSDAELRENYDRQARSQLTIKQNDRLRQLNSEIRAQESHGASMDAAHRATLEFQRRETSRDIARNLNASFGDAINTAFKASTSIIAQGTSADKILAGDKVGEAMQAMLLQAYSQIDQTDLSPSEKQTMKADLRTQTESITGLFEQDATQSQRIFKRLSDDLQLDMAKSAPQLHQLTTFFPPQVLAQTFAQEGFLNQVVAPAVQSAVNEAFTSSDKFNNILTTMGDIKGKGSTVDVSSATPEQKAAVVLTMDDFRKGLIAGSVNGQHITPQQYGVYAEQLRNTIQSQNADDYEDTYKAFYNQGFVDKIVELKSQDPVAASHMNQTFMQMITTYDKYLAKQVAELSIATNGAVSQDDDGTIVLDASKLSGRDTHYAIFQNAVALKNQQIQHDKLAKAWAESQK